MASILAKILDGEITSEDLADPCHINRNENDDVKDAKENFKQHNITELVPFLLNYLREKSFPSFNTATKCSIDSQRRRQCHKPKELFHNRTNTVWHKELLEREFISFTKDAITIACYPAVTESER
ncbi:hypothetical protein OS493_032858 [Desmophyllum pertusum]|uniref:Uncharacterized protein n=1 Tax=Desmophyllum pertusum TaxID=174260 RepID=A0A9W9YME4_9CNID|nr:hypothetical protein OS493_032858 [Desmophyllum pertusum]